MDNTSIINTNPTDNSSEQVGNMTIPYLLAMIGREFFNVYNIYLYLMIIFGVVGNVIVLLVFLNNRPSTTTDWFILSITVCDFISSFVNVPVYSTFTNGYWNIYGTTLICRLHMFLSQSIVLSSSFLICGLALDRYLTICKHLSSFTTTRARNVCLSITVLTTVLSTPSFVMYENRRGKCEAIIMNKTLFLYYLFVFLIFVFATFVVVFSYCKVTKAVIASETNIARHSGNYELNRRNKHFCCCCCFPYKRTNTVAPSTITTSRNELFRGSSSSSRNTPTQRENYRLEVPRPKHIRTITHGQVTSVSGQMPELVTEDNQMCNRVSDSHTRQRKSASLRTTKISFLVCSVFILTWIPPWLCFVLAAIPGMKSNMNVLKFMIFGKMTYLINGFSNPIIYTLMNKKFRRRILEIFCPCKI